MRGDSLIGAFAAQKSGDNVIYPLQDFIAHRDSNSFYPARSFHFRGESIWLVAQRYFERLHLEPSTVPRGTRAIEIKSELSRQLGFDLPVTINSVFLDRSGLSQRAWPEIPNFRQNFLRSYPRGADVGYFENDAAKSDATALLLSNSFGVRIRGYLTLGYKTLFHVNISQLRREELKSDAFFAFLMKTLKPDQVIVVSHDGGADGIIARIAGAVGGR